MSKLAFVFPGQGSQSIGMLADLASEHSIVTETFSTASESLGYDLWELVQRGPEEKLNKTDHTQPAMLVAGVATWQIWREQNGSVPEIMAGHSLGEYSALVCADSISLQDAVTLVADRGHFMQEAVPEGEGAMAAILGLDDETVIAVCNESAQNEIVSAVNFNSPGQVVIAGNTSAVDRATNLAKDNGAKRAVVLPVSVPSHCLLMKQAAERLSERLLQVEINTPSIPVIHNTDVQSHDSADDIREALVRQLYNPVRWVQTIEYINKQGIDTIIECGPGKVLTGLNKRINKNMSALAIFDPASLALGLEQTR